MVTIYPFEWTSIIACCFQLLVNNFSYYKSLSVESLTYKLISKRGQTSKSNKKNYQKKFLKEYDPAFANLRQKLSLYVFCDEPVSLKKLKQRELITETELKKQAEKKITPVQEQENVEPTSTKSAGSKEWCDDEIRLLVKGTKVVALGTADRWAVVAAFIEEHSRGKFKRTGKDVLAKTKELQKMG